MDNEIQDLILSLHEDGLLEPCAPLKRPEQQAPASSFPYGHLLFSIAILCIFLVSLFTVLHRSPQSSQTLRSYESPYIALWPKSQQNLALESWEENHLNDSLPSPLSSQYDIVCTIHARSEALDKIKEKVQYLLDNLTESPDPSELEHLSELICSFQRTDLFYSSTLDQLSRSFNNRSPDEQKHFQETLHITGLDHGLQAYRKLMERVHSAQEELQTFTLEKPQSIEELLNSVQNAQSMLTKMSADPILKIFIHGEAERERILASTHQALNSIIDQYSSQPCATALSEIKALWQLQTLLPNVEPQLLSKLDKTLSTHPSLAYLLDQTNLLHETAPTHSSSLILYPSEA